MTQPTEPNPDDASTGRDGVDQVSEPTFLGIPERWLDDPSWKCGNGHISRRFLKSEARGDLCLACLEPVRLCDPDEREAVSERVADHERTQET